MKVYHLGIICLTAALQCLCIDRGNKPKIECPRGDGICDKDRLGYEAIAYVHSKLDDDKDGNVDLSESDEFLRDELQYNNGGEDGTDRHTSFHGNDQKISVEDLWRQWKHSEVYNWTVDDVVEWLVYNVDLPQYEDNFRVNAVDGTVLPRLAANNNHYLSGIIGIKVPVEKRKLNLKAMDVVLFGSPKKRHNFVKDIALLVSVVIAVLGCCYAYMQQKQSKAHLKKMIQDLDNLQQAEDALTDMQAKLDLAQMEQKTLTEEKERLETQTKEEILTAKHEAERLHMTRAKTENEITRLKMAEEELVQVRSALRKAEKEIERKNWSAPTQLQKWLQLTYEIELIHYNDKKTIAEKQLHNAKEACERLRKKRQGFMGSLRVAHSNSTDDIDKIILNARGSLEEVRNDLQERLQRWQCMENMCGFHILNNPGADLAESDQKVSDVSVKTLPLSIEDGSDDELPPSYHALNASRQCTKGVVNDQKSIRQPSVSSTASSQEDSMGSNKVKFGLEESEENTNNDAQSWPATKNTQANHSDSSSRTSDSIGYKTLISFETSSPKPIHHASRFTMSQSESCLGTLDERIRTNSDASSYNINSLVKKLNRKSPNKDEENANSSSSPDDNQDDNNKNVSKKKKTKKIGLLRAGFLMRKDHVKVKTN